MNIKEVLALAERMEAWAQNEEMIDGSYLAHGSDCLEAAAALRHYLWKQKQTLLLLQKDVP